MFAVKHIQIFSLYIHIRKAKRRYGNSRREETRAKKKKKAMHFCVNIYAIRI